MQIQAYLDNVFDVGGLLEDAETKNAALEKVEELEEHLSHVSALARLDHLHCSLVSLMRFVCGFRSYVVNCVVYRWQLEIDSMFAFYKWCSLMTGCSTIGNTENVTILILFSQLAYAFCVVAFVSHAALQRPSSHGKVVGSSDITQGISKQTLFSGVMNVGGG